MNAVILGIVMASVLLAIILARMRTYRRVFSNAHLLEAAQGVAAVKQAALLHIEEPGKKAPMAASDPRHCVTSERLVYVHTITQHETRFVHHLSVSLGGGATPMAVGRLFLAVAMLVLGVDAAGFVAHVTQKGRFHLEFEMTPAEQAEFAARRSALPDPADIQGFRDRAQAAQGELRVERIKPAAKPAGPAE